MDFGVEVVAEVGEGGDEAVAKFEDGGDVHGGGEAGVMGGSGVSSVRGA